MVGEDEDAPEAAEHRVSPWEPGVKDHLVRITPTEVSGRRFVISHTRRWWPPLES
ncbi:hypothetical protein [Pseudarthrobacter cellobiosi]|uniref:hypothetical protein n=1 Tax=Pseudarthrobacter cellobiosi TaxID=2953654 RepID=UPI0027E22424|nr:hypothetical protein [Pseudarthrobacter sp. HLT3-5]